MIRISGRAALVTALVAVLTLVGGGGAVAYWSVSAQVEAAAATASVGLSQTVHPSVETTPLKVTYSSSNLTAAGAVTVVNTGTREADYSITLASQSPTAPGLPGAITVAVAQVVSVDACTPTTALTAPQTGTLSSTPGFTAHGVVDAGATIILCVQTSLSAAGATAYANASTGVSMTTELEYAPLDEWMRDTSFSFTQSVGSSLLFFTDSSARYNVLNGANCLQRYSGGVAARARLPEKCGGDWESEWRISAAGDGTFYVSMTNNDLSAETAPRWTAAGPGATTVSVSPISTNADQKWRITALSGDQFQIASVAYPDLCLTIGQTRWDGGTGPLRLMLAACDQSAGQAFTFDMIGNPIREPADMTCNGAAWNLQMWFPPNTGYEQEITYRAFVAREATPETGVVIGTGGLSQNHTTMQLNASDLSGLVNSSGGATGNAWVYVEERITTTGKWQLAAKGKIRTLMNAGSVNIMCGWQ